MITAETKRVCDQAERDIRKLMPEARNAFNNCTNSLDTIESTYRANPAIELAMGPFSKWLKSGIEEFESVDRLFKSKVESAIRPMTNMLTTLLRSGKDAENILYIVEKLESLAQNASSFKCVVWKRNLSFTMCHDYLVAEAKRWREKVTNDPSVRKAILTAQLEENQNKLEMAKKELASNQSAIEDSKKKIAEIFETYQDKVEKLLLDVKSDYQNKLTAIEKAQKLAAEKFAARSSAYELFASASLFNRKKRETAYHLAEQEYRKACSALKQLETELKSFAVVVFKPKFAKIEKQVDDLLSDIDNSNDQICANQNAIQGYTNAITNIKKELKVG